MRGEGSASRCGHGTAAACCVHFGDSDEIAGSNTYAARPFIWRQGREQLNYLPIDIEGDQAATIGIKPGNRTRFVLDRALESTRGFGLEPKEKAPERPDEQRLEGSARDDRSPELPWLTQGTGGDSAGTK